MLISYVPLSGLVLKVPDKCSSHVRGPESSSSFPVDVGLGSFVPPEMSVGEINL